MNPKSLAALEPGPLRLYFSGLWGEEEFWEGVLSQGPTAAGVHLVRAERLRKARRFNLALGEAKRAQRLEPRSGRAHALAAKILLSQAAPSGRRALLRFAPRIKTECLTALKDARCLWVYNIFELVLCAEDKPHEAYRMLTALARKHPGRPELLTKLSMQEFGGDLDTTAARLDEAIRLRPGWTFLSAFRGELRRLRGQAKAASRDLDHAVRVSPSYDRAYLWRAKLRRTAGALAAADRDLSRSLSLEPRYSRAHFELALLRADQGRLSDAVRALERAEALENGYPWNGPVNEITTAWAYRRFGLLCRLHRWEKALACLTEVRARDAKYLWSTEGRSQEALAALDAAVSRYPAQAWFLAWRGQTLTSAGEHLRAKADLDRALILDPKPAWFRVWRADASLRLGRPEECLEDLAVAVRAPACRGRALGLRAEARLATGRWAAALVDARTAERLVPTGIWATLAAARALRGLGRMKEARAALKRALRHAPGDRGVLALLPEFGMRDAFYPFDASSWGAACATTLSPAELRSLYRRNTVRLRRELRSASKIGLAMTHAKRGWVSIKGGAMLRALDDMDQAVALDPENASYRIWRSVARLALGRRAAARTDFTRAVKLSPDWIFALSGDKLVAG